MRMKSVSMVTLGTGIILLLSLGVPTTGVADGWNSDDRRPRDRRPGPAIEALRDGVFSAYRNRAPENYQPDPFCTSGGNGGAMGIHFVNFDNFFAALGGEAPELNKPEVLIYEPLPGGRIRLVGAEYIAAADSAPAAVEGHLLNFAASPNRYGVPVPYLQLHVWAWKHNPNGAFANWNPNVSCNAYDPNLHPQPDPA